VGETLPINPSSQEHADYPKTLRYLRASHSILGGVWIGDQVKTIDNALPILDEQGTPLGDSIYSAFVLQEAARLVNIKEGGQQNALFMYEVSSTHLLQRLTFSQVVSVSVSLRPLSTATTYQQLL
jgi:hypothetical protein